MFLRRLASLSALLLVITACSQEKAGKGLTPEPAESQDPPAMSINGKIFSKADLDMHQRLMAFFMDQTGMKPPSDQGDYLRKQAAASLLQIELMVEAAEQDKLSVTPAEVDADLNEAAQRVGSREKLDAALQAVSLPQDYFRKQLERNLLVNKYLQKIRDAQPEVTEEEMQKFYKENEDKFENPERVRASHILIKVEQNAKPEERAAARKKAQDVLKRLKAGEDFAAVAKEVSDCPSAQQGGDLGFFSRGQMVPPFEQAAFSLQPGKLSDIVETQFGYHIIKVAEHQKAAKVPYEEAKERIRSYLKQQQERFALRDTLQDRVKRAKVEYLDPTLKPAEPQAPQPSKQAE
jgi:peptidyl-prolyl cis-trans isomerase C